MLPLRDWPLAERQSLTGLFTDIDDTLTHNGSIVPSALQALHDLRHAGVRVIAITGRAVGWCQQHVSGAPQPAWPVDAIVAENGALAWVCKDGTAPVKHYQQDATERAAHQIRMRAVTARVLREVPEARTTGDADTRETDLTFDHAEHCAPEAQRTARILDILHAEGMHTSVSSIHIHGCFAHFDKWLGAQWITQLLYGERLERNLAHWAFIGDSGNDQAMFAHVPASVGVANIRQHAPGMQQLPRYITQATHGHGFAEMARAVLHARNGHAS